YRVETRKVRCRLARCGIKSRRSCKRARRCIRVCNGEGGMTAKGLEHIIVGTTSLSLVDGEKGRLVYRGYAIEDLAQHATFEDVAYLLWYGHKGTPVQVSALRSAMTAQR